MRIDRHIFGSVHGYQTLARTDGITDADSRVLEGLSVGAPANSSVLAGLSASPTYVVLPLGVRRAVTQISQGGPDDQGRPTLLHVTLAVARAEWDGVLQGDVLSLIRRKDLWKWDGQPTIQALDLPANAPGNAAVSPDSVDKILAILSLLERGMGQGKPVLVRDEHCTLEEFSLLERLLPPAARASQTLVYRAFGSKLRASFICMARGASGMGTHGLYRPDQPVDLSPYALAVAQAGFKLGYIPYDLVRSYRGFGATIRSRAPAVAPPRQAPPANFPTQVIVERMPPGLLLGMVATCVLLATLAGTAAWLVRGSMAKSAYDAKVTELGKTHAKEIARASATIIELLKAIHMPVFAHAQREDVIRKCQEAADKVPESADYHKALENRITELRMQHTSMDKKESQDVAAVLRDLATILSECKHKLLNAPQKSPPGKEQ